MKLSQWYGVVLIVYLLLKSTGVIGGAGCGGIFKIPLVDPWFVVVEESGDRPAFVSALVADADLWKQAETLGVRYRFMDVDSPDASSYSSKAREIGLPAYLFINDGKVLSSGKCPESREAVLRVLNQEG